MVCPGLAGLVGRNLHLAALLSAAPSYPLAKPAFTNHALNGSLHLTTTPLTKLGSAYVSAPQGTQPRDGLGGAPKQTRSACTTWCGIAPRRQHAECVDEKTPPPTNRSSATFRKAAGFALTTRVRSKARTAGAGAPCRRKTQSASDDAHYA